MVRINIIKMERNRSEKFAQSSFLFDKERTIGMYRILEIKFKKSH
jgi:hypothetical protein